MSKEAEAPPSTEHPAPLTESTAPAGSTTPEVDFDRVLAGDEDYIKAANEALGAVVPAEPVPEPDTKSEEKKEVAAPPAAEAEEADVPLIFRGKEIPVPKTKKERVALMQKGMALDARLDELSPVIALAREVPELAEKLRTPEGRKQVIERIRQHEKAVETGEDLPEVEGYDKDDVKAVDKILRARMKALGIVPPEQAGRPDPAQVAALEADQRDMAHKTRITLESLRSVDPHYEETMELLKEVVAEVERTTPPEQFRQFYEVINDPRKIDPSTGRPAFLNFYADVAKERERRASLNTAAAPEIPNIPRKVQATSGRLAPGAATSPATAATPGVLRFESEDAFNRAFDEALARG